MIRAALLAATAALVAFTGTLVRLTHSFYQFEGQNSFVEINCGILSASSNGYGSATGLGACEALVEKINTDDSAVYIVVDSSAADRASSLDLAAGVAAGLVVLAALFDAAAEFAPVFTSLALQAYAAAAAAALAMLNYAAHLSRSLDSAPDPGADSSASVSFGIFVLAALPIFALIKPATEALQR